MSPEESDQLEIKDYREKLDHKELLVYKELQELLDQLDHLGKQVLKEQVGLDAQDFQLFDGSGLSQYNLISANQLSRLLYVIYHDELYPVFKRAMSLSGVNGNLSARFKTFDTKAKLTAKTGTLTGHSTLAGFLVDKDGKELIISIMVNNSVNETKRLKAFEEQMVLSILQSIEDS